MSLLPRFYKAFLYISLFFSGFAHGETIKHIFLALDESRHQLLLVDQFNPENDWTIEVGRNRDMQLIAGNKILISKPKGYQEYNLADGSLAKEVKFGSGIASIIRNHDGSTYLANKQKIWLLDNNDKLIATLPINMGKYMRLLRINKQGNYLFTGAETVIKEADKQGQIVREFDLKLIAPATKKPYFALELKNDNYLVSTGYGASLLEINKQGELIKVIGGRGTNPDVLYNFFGAVTLLDNGNVVVANWTGHGKNDSEKAPQILEFDSAGKLIWQWHDPVRAGSIHSVVVLK
ncbi:hypothetical protein [Thalassomonas sp. M1454]|uniref:hypothetical protein n=1 Tax=Thalassomonas sp. M1454 TaxID=2594477 RepID=UPI0011802E38|nr:hypothetical protein [Thalassomonas sp. M1454]TRX52734.1 hypothetical protein FNN08_15340 [Thalassomonas sp. M1454]